MMNVKKKKQNNNNNKQKIDAIYLIMNKVKKK